MMARDRIRDLYRVALGSEAVPFRYQEILAEEPICNRAVIVPTGSGKTAAAVLSWLYQLEISPVTTPLRLVYCLPMRALVEQTRRVLAAWLKNLGRQDVMVYTLMGGEIDEDWEFSPSQAMILVGTQDMLLSRALNRGYAMSRYRWPLHFALLNNDCFWVIDEVQLFGSGLASSTQLQAFRETWQIMGATATWWMSATFDPEWLATVDFAAKARSLPVTRLEPDDLDPQKSPELAKRYRALKPVTEMKKLSAEAVREVHRKGTLTLVVVNTVARANELFYELRGGPGGKRSKKHKDKSGPKTLLLHSRFRPPDRARHHERLVAADQILRGASDTGTNAIWGEEIDALREQGAICVATQVVEAGLDLSAETLITEIAPWASMVQRFGRCNRFGLQENARVFWIDLNRKDEILPYEAEDLKETRERLARLPGSYASPEALEGLGPPSIRPAAHVIRRHDLLGLFSTEPDLAGGFTDVSRFVRDLEHDTDAYVFWREFKEEPSEEARPHAEEICSAPIGSVRDFLQGKSSWEWNGELRRWDRRSAREIRPGMTLLLSCNVGGYDAELGWTGDADDRPESLALPGEEESDSQTADGESESDWVPLLKHLSNAEAECPSIRGMRASEEDTVRLALRWHDVGKAHRKWQEAITKAGLEIPDGGPWAKFPKSPGSFRPALRHEAASALAAWQKWIAGEEGWTALAVYLIAAHHGKVRTVLRSRIKNKPGGDDVFGIKQGDTLSLAGRIESRCVLDLSPRIFGASGAWEDAGFRKKAPGWVEVVAALVGSENDADILEASEAKGLGPFRLAMLEACVTIADICASRAEERRK